MKELDELLTTLQSKIPHQERTIPNISKASVGWHIEHSLLIFNFIIDALGKSNPDAYKGSFDIRRIAVMLLEKFPRGRVQAPKATRPTTEFNFETLQQHISISREKLKTLQQLNAGHYFTHPFLGDFRLKSAIKFIRIHTNHHLNIINDIVRSCK